MNKLKNMSESDFLKVFFGFITACFLIAAVCVPDRSNMFNGMWQILSQPAKISSNYFSLAGYSATLLNMGLVGLICLALFLVLKGTANNVSTFGFLLTVGFGAWGITPINFWPTALGVALYCLVKKEKLAANINAMMFATGIAPLINDLLVRYPSTEVLGFNLPGVLVALLAGLFIGFLMPAGLGHAPNFHKGFNLYSAAVPVCFIAFFLNATLYKTMGLNVGDLSTTGDMSVVNPLLVNVFCLVVFVACIVVAFLMGCTLKDYWKLLTSKEHVTSISGKMGTPVFLMNAGIFGLFILAYYNIIGAPFNAVTFGLIFCMVCTCNSGSHPGNVWPIMLGYVVASFVFGWLSTLAGGNFSLVINNQAIVVGLCFANGLSPITSKYGWFWGALAAMMHYMLVTSVPNMHGGFCLYNGGFTAAAICLLLVPVLERCVKTKEEKLAAKQ